MRVRERRAVGGTAAPLHLEGKENKGRRWTRLFSLFSKDKAQIGGWSTSQLESQLITGTVFKDAEELSVKPPGPPQTPPRLLNDADRYHRAAFSHYFWETHRNKSCLRGDDAQQLAKECVWEEEAVKRPGARGLQRGEPVLVTSYWKVFFRSKFLGTVSSPVSLQGFAQRMALDGRGCVGAGPARCVCAQAIGGELG